jgi:hypothetical protein
MSVNKLYVVVRGTGGEIWRNELDLTDPTQNNAWSSWIRTGGAGWTPSTPAVLAMNGRLDLLVRGAGNTIWHWSETAASWENIPGTTPDTPVAAYRDTNSGLMIELVVRGTDSGIYHKILNTATGTWTDWTKIPGATPSTPAILVDQWNDELYLTVRGTDNNIYFGSILLWVGPPP